MRRRRRGPWKPPPLSPGQVKNEINVTPLVDVVLVLLIIFMVVTPMLSRGVAVDLPIASHPEKRNDTGEEVMVSITQDGKVFIDADAVPEGELVDRVKRAMAKSGRGVHVKGDRRLHYGEVRKVLEGIHEAGASQVALGTEEKKEER
jgi:biopolymer transport protein TolR